MIKIVLAITFAILVFSPLLQVQAVEQPVPCPMVMAMDHGAMPAADTSPKLCAKCTVTANIAVPNVMPIAALTVFETNFTYQQSFNSALPELLQRPPRA